jgi:hypothetical protein
MMQKLTRHAGLTKGKNGANAIFWLRQLQSVVQETSENKDNAPKATSPVVLNRTCFAHPLRQDMPVLKGIGLHVAKGTFVALVGASGCGTSTIVSMLGRFYDPTSGSVSVAGESLATLNPRKYRSQVGLVWCNSSPTLFQGTIRENIALGVHNPEATEDIIGVSDAKIEMLSAMQTRGTSCLHFQKASTLPLGRMELNSPAANDNVSPTPSLLFATLAYYCSTRQLVRWTPRARGLCRMLCRMRQKRTTALLLRWRIGCQRSKMRICFVYLTMGELWSKGCTGSCERGMGNCTGKCVRRKV